MTPYDTCEGRRSMINKKKSTIAVLGASALALGLAACGDGGDGGAEGELQDSYVVVSDTSFVPFAFEEGGEFVGFDMDMINTIADRVGFEIELETTNFDGIIPGLQTGSFEIAIAGIGITEERAEIIDYTSPYYMSGLRIAVPIDDTEIESVEDLEGRTIATRLGSTSAAYIEENIEGATANTYEQLDQAYLSVEGGGSEAILYDAPNVEYYVATAGEGSLKVTGDLFEAENYGIAVTQGHPELVEAMNEAIAEIIDDGTYAEIYAEWFGEEPAWLDELAAQAD